MLVGWAQQNDQRNDRPPHSLNNTANAPHVVHLPRPSPSLKPTPFVFLGRWRHRPSGVTHGLRSPNSCRYDSR